MLQQNKPCSILVIDDDEDDFFYIKDLLRSLGPKLFELEWASNFDMGYQKMLENRHHIYLIDHLLGKGTGLELIKKASEISAPKILLTGMGNRDLDIIAIRSGADDYLPKSQLTTEILERTIRHALERFDQRSIIEREQQKFKTLFDQSTDPIFITDNDRIVIDANSAFCSLFGIKDDEIGNCSLKSIFVQQSDYEDFITASENTAYSSTQSVQLESGTNGLIDAIISSSPLYSSADKQLVAYQGLIHDITKLKKMEDDLQMIEKINLTGKMIRTIAHDIRNPLTNISLASEQLASELTPEQDDLHLFTDIINRNSVKINQLISTLLNNTRSTQPDLEEMPVETAVQEAIDNVADRLQLKGIALDTEGLENETMVKIDKERLKTAFSNILTNAIEAMEMSKKPSLKISTQQKHNAAYIIISDTGKGMDSDTLSKLFDPFFTNRPGGLGLGMTAVQQIIHQHNGSIRIESTPGSGSTFEIQIPVN
ncbi:MAG: ATP-binding protein [Bacteroidota bacterium]